MATADVVYEETEEQRIESWRLEALERAGYDRRAAFAIARRHDVDLHRAVEMLDRGCPAELAVKILL
jgi:hypothetical protein